MKKNTFRIFLIALLIVTIPFPAYADYGTIQIDGYYDDWEDKPHTEVYPGKNPSESKINNVSLFRDEANVYIHVVFAHKNNQDIKNMTINLDTNLGGKDYFIVPDNWFNETNSPESEPTPDDQITETTETTETTEENLFAGSDQQTILLVAEEEGNINNNTDADTDTNTNTDTDPIETNTDPIETNTDQVTVNDEGDQTSDPEIDGGPIEDFNNENPEDMLDLLDPDNFADPDVILDQFVPEVTSDPAIETDEPDPDLNMKKPELYGTVAFSVYDKQSSVGSGYYTRTEGEADELELYIPLSSITNQYDGITEISMIIKKLGPQVIICAGASAEPYIGVAIGAGIAMLSVGAYSYKKKVGAYSYKKKSEGRSH